MPTKFEMVDASFGEDIDAEMNRFVEQQLTWLEQSHQELHKTLIPKWRKLYLGTPAEAAKNFPFPNAANTVVQVVGETVDAMTARVLGLVWATHPAWTFHNYLKTKDNEEQKVNETRRGLLEDFMDLVGYEPTELDLYRVEGQWFTDAAKLGTSFVKLSVEDNVEAVVVGYNEGKIQGEETPMYQGPRVTKLRHEDVKADPAAQTLEDSGLVAVKRTLKRWELEERKFKGHYKEDAVKSILNSPDRSNAAPQTQEELKQQGISNPAIPDTTAEWDIEECYFPWWYRGRKYRIICWYHKKTKTVLRRVFNFLPNHDLGIKRAKLGYRTDGLYGHGYAELLETYQEELSTTHNQRLDNATVANIRALRVSPRARALDANVELYPAALLVGEKDEIESIAVGDVYPSTFKNEEMTLGLVARRSGITPPQSGFGTGGMMRRPAVYSAQGTLAVMQENNSVVGHATSEFRHAHAMLGSSLTAMYGKFGTFGKEQMFGLDGQQLREALEAFAHRRIQIPIRSSNASLNKEVDKQTGMLLAGLLQRHYTAVGQLMQAMNNPMLPPEVKEYFVRVIAASEWFHKRVVKDFGYEQPDLYVPEAQVGQGSNPQAGGGAPPQGVSGGQMAPGQPPMAGGGPAAGGGGAPLLPIGGMAGGGGGLAPLTGAGPR